MEWFIAVIAVAALGVAAMAAAGGMGQMSREPVYDTYRQDLPDRPLGAEDIRRLRFGIALRGYAMSQVDDVLDRLAAEIAARDARIAELTTDASAESPPPSELPPTEELQLTRHPSGAPTVAESDEVDFGGPRPRRAHDDAS
jgi:DivIVA domain-containing protein